MISFDFDYFRPDTLEEAIACYHSLAQAGKTPVYYGGGTELISMARAESLGFGAVVDLKGIPQCTVLAQEGQDLILGSGLTLTQIAESGCYPLLGETVARIADHTIQGKITLGGNLAGSIIYREAALPLMISNCRAKVMTRSGLEERLFCDIFDGRLALGPGEFLVQLLIHQEDLGLPYNHAKKTKMDKIDYPLITLAADMKDGCIRAAISGAGHEPFLLPGDVLNDGSLAPEARVAQVMAQVEGRLVGDLLGSRAYRGFVLGNMLRQMLDNFKEGLA